MRLDRLVCLVLGALGGGGSLVLACLDPTEIRLSITTDFPCSSLAEDRVALRVGREIVANGPVNASSRTCVNQKIGTLVLTPGDAPRVSLEVMAAIAPATLDAAGNCVEGSAGCIHVRRAVSYIDHKRLDLPIVLEVDCAGVVCDPSSTCAGRKCVPSTCVDNSCAQSDAGAPPDTGVGDAGPYATMCGDVTALQAGAPYPMSCGCPGGGNVSASVGRATPPSAVNNFGLTGLATDIVIDKNNIAYVATNSSELSAFTLAENPPRQLWSVKTAPMTGSSMVIAATDLLYLATDNRMAQYASDGGENGFLVTKDTVRSGVNILPNGRMVFADPTGGVQSMDPKPFAYGPSASLSGAVDNIRATVADGLLWQGVSDGTMQVIDPSTMTLVPSSAVILTSAGFAIDSVSALGPDGLLRVVWGVRGGTYEYAAVDRKAAKVVWTKTLPGGMHAAVDLAGVTTTGALWVSDDNHDLFAFDSSGAMLSKFSGVTRMPGFDLAGNVYLTDQAKVSSYDEHGTLRWVANGIPGANVMIFRVANNGVLVGADENTPSVYVFSGP